MPTALEQLQLAGFSEEEIGGWAKEQRATLSSAGFGDDEIDRYLQGPPPSSQGLFKRLLNTPREIGETEVSVLKGAWTGFRSGFFGEMPPPPEKMGRAEAGGAIP